MPSVSKEYSFSAAHHLPQMPDGHPCKRVHGHNYTIKIEVTGPLNDKGMVIDYGDIDKLVKPIIERYDHRDLNETLSTPTAENIAHRFYNSISMVIPLSIKVRVKETDKTEAVYP